MPKCPIHKKEQLNMGHCDAEYIKTIQIRRCQHISGVGFCKSCDDHRAFVEVSVGV